MANALEISRIGDIEKLGGMTMEEILDRMAMQNSMSNGENASKYGYMVKFTDSAGNPLVNFPVYKVADGTVESNLLGYTNKSGTLTMMLADAMDLYLYCPDDANRKYAYGRVISGMGQIASETLVADKKFELRYTTSSGTALANTNVYNTATQNVAFTTDASGYIKLTDFLAAAGNKASSSLSITAQDANTFRYGAATVSFNIANGLTKSIATSTAMPVANLTAGQTLTFAGATWRCVHVSGSTKYIIREDIVEETQFGSNNTYAGSTLASKAKNYESNIPAEIRPFVDNTTVNGVTAKVFAPSYEQMNGGFSYFNSNNARIAKLNGTAKAYWTSSPNSSSYVWNVNTDGNLYSHGDGPSNTYGFRPCVAMKG